MVKEKIPRFGHDVYVSKLTERDPTFFENYELRSEYKGSDLSIDVYHKECGTTFSSRAGHILRGGRCKKCSMQKYHTQKILTHEKFVENLLTKRPNFFEEYEFLSEYTLQKETLKVQHKVCGNISNVLPTNLIRGSECFVCARKKSNTDRCRTTSEFIELMNKLDSDFLQNYSLESEYIPNPDKMSFRHRKCNKVFKTLSSNVIKGDRCPFCATTSSKGENEVVDFIKKICKNKYTVEVKRRGILPNTRLELDIYVPELKIAIEYNGEYWHNETLNNGKDYEKFLQAVENDIRIVCIYESEWKTNKELLKDKLQNILGLSNNPRIYARKCSFAEITVKEKNDFFDANHIQKKDTTFIHFALKHEDATVAVMSFSKPRKALNATKNFVELSRYATLQGYNVVGGFSKLLKKAANDSAIQQFDKILTYANLRYSEGNVYTVNGFELTHISNPSYWYFERSKQTAKLYHRFNFIKSNIKKLYENGTFKFYDDSLTEKENMLKNGYYTIKDYGNAVFVYDL